MKLARCIWQESLYVAVVDEARTEVRLVGEALEPAANPLLAVIEQGVNALRSAASRPVPLADVRFLAPFPALVRNVFAVGKNYTDHSLEFDRSGFNATAAANAGIPSHPQLFTKATTSLTGPDDPIRFDPAYTRSVDYEGEIAVVIGARCREVSRADALDVVFGYVLLNDVTARDLQRDHAQWFLGKSLDTFCPLGPWIATRDEVGIESLRIRTWVNDELRQDAMLSQLIFDIPTLIETLSRGTTLLAGDIIATGTPVGVGIGFSPPRFLRDGDVVRVAAPGLGELTNRVEAVGP